MFPGQFSTNHTPSTHTHTLNRPVWGGTTTCGPLFRWLSGVVRTFFNARVLNTAQNAIIIVCMEQAMGVCWCSLRAHEPRMLLAASASTSLQIRFTSQTREPNRPRRDFPGDFASKLYHTHAHKHSHMHTESQRRVSRAHMNYVPKPTIEWQNLRDDTYHQSVCAVCVSVVSRSLCKIEQKPGNNASARAILCSQVHVPVV